MTQTPNLQEDYTSQLPALRLLIGLGYEYISPSRALELRGGDEGRVILKPILEKQLRKLNKIHYKDEVHEFSDANISHAIDALKDQPLNEGLGVANKKVYELITKGKSFPQLVKGDKKSFTLKYIDWENIENNVFHVTEEYVIEQEDGKGTRRPDIVLFVNGIPLAVIEAKRPDLDTKEGTPVEQAISQMTRNQKDGYIRNLFIYSSLHLAIAGNEAKYGTTETPSKFWAVWREEDKEIGETEKNAKLDSKVITEILQQRPPEFRHKAKNVLIEDYTITEQDRLIYSLCRPERLLKLIDRYIVFDGKDKKVARYQQFFAIEKTINRIKYLKGDQREGGVIWHTQGSGKSLTMSMLTKAIQSEEMIRNPKVVVVTDRVSLDKQIHETFSNTDVDVVRASSSKNLAKNIQSPKSTVITTVINKFEAIAKSGKVHDESPDIFILVDESHRGHYGSLHKAMREVFPNACYIGLTGTPLMKREKNTADKFGGFIHKYTVDQAVKDKAVLPLLYEGRHILQDVNQQALDSFFERVSEDLSDKQKAELKKKFAKHDAINQAKQRLYAIALDISDHFSKEIKQTGFKGQITAPSKRAAVILKNYFDQIGKVETEVIISPVDTREGHEDVFDEPDDIVQQFWTKMMKKYGSEEEYNKHIVDGFKDGDYPEVLIVVDKLLTGFDAPVNFVLYILRSLKEHTLLQAIARVNRLRAGKEYGLIIDYYGILGDLDKALTTYSSLGEFDEEDLSGMMTSVWTEIEKLPQLYENLIDLFKEIQNKDDFQAYLEILRDEDIREDFYKRLSKFARILKLGLGTYGFEEKIGEKNVDKYKRTLEFYMKLRKKAVSIYSDSLRYKEYEKQIQQLIDTHVTATETLEINEEPVNIFDKEAFNKEVAQQAGEVAKADTMISRLKKVAYENMDEDPAYYKKLSAMIKKLIDDYLNKRISEKEYFSKANTLRDDLYAHQESRDSSVPERIRGNGEAIAYRGIVQEKVSTLRESNNEEISAEIALKIDEIIDEMAIVDWYKKEDVINDMRQEIEDYILDQVNTRYDWKINYDQIDEIVEACIKTAKARLVK